MVQFKKDVRNARQAPEMVLVSTKSGTRNSGWYIKYVFRNTELVCKKAINFNVRTIPTLYR
jgi:hypothetical protein